MNEARPAIAKTEEQSGRSRGRPTRNEGVTIDAAIVASAIEVLMERGEQATINDVAIASGHSRKTIYARYANRSELFRHAMRQLLARSRRIPIPATGSIEQRLHGYFRAALDTGATHQARAIQRVLTFNPNYVGSLQNELRDSSERQLVAPLLEFLEAASVAGELQTADPRTTAEIMAKLILAESLIPEQAGAGPEGAAWREKRARFLAGLLASALSTRRASK